MHDMKDFSPTCDSIIPFLQGVAGAEVARASLGSKDAADASSDEGSDDCDPSRAAGGARSNIMTLSATEPPERKRRGKPLLLTSPREEAAGGEDEVGEERSAKCCLCWGVSSGCGGPDTAAAAAAAAARRLAARRLSCSIRKLASSAAPALLGKGSSKALRSPAKPPPAPATGLSMPKPVAALVSRARWCIRLMRCLASAKRCRILSTLAAWRLGSGMSNSRLFLLLVLLAAGVVVVAVVEG